MTVREKTEDTPLAIDTSFETLLASERTRLVGFCTHLTGNPEVAEDLAQETLLEAWRNQQKVSAHDFACPNQRMQWLMAIARNVCLRWGRSYGRDLAHLAQYSLSAASEGEPAVDLDELPASGYNLEIELERDELARLLDRALALLPPTTRAVLIERYIRESTHSEITTRLGLSEDALVQRLYRGKLALRRVMETELNAEAAAYGLVEMRHAHSDTPLEQETRIWCPMCDKRRLKKFVDPTTRRTFFSCPDCWQLAALALPYLWQGLHNPKAILNRQLAHLSEYYWQAIANGESYCLECGYPVHPQIVEIQDFPQMFRSSGRGYGKRGLYLRCDHCKDESLNMLLHLTIDVPESQQFWRQHPRMLWLPEREINYAGQPALLSGFQSTLDSARLDIIYQRNTLKILGIHETTC